MLDRIRPLEWVDPNLPNEENKQPIYDMVCIGGGAAGMVCSAGTAWMGGKALMIERKLMGGDCLVTGCVPSKAFLKSAKVAHQIRTSAEFGIEINGNIKVNFAKVMERMRKIRNEIAYHDSAENFSKEYNIDIVLGEAKFIDANTIRVNGKDIKFFRATICSGGRPRIPTTIAGLENVHHYTSENIFNLVHQPKKLMIVGAGPIGCELGQGFQRLGTDVTFIQRSKRIMPKEDADAADIVLEQMKADGCDFKFDAVINSVRILEPPAEGEHFPTIEVKLRVGT